MATLGGLFCLAVGILGLIYWPRQRRVLEQLRRLHVWGINEEVLVTGVIHPQNPASFWIIWRHEANQHGWGLSLGGFEIERKPQVLEARPSFLLRSGEREIWVRGHTPEQACEMEGVMTPPLLQRLANVGRRIKPATRGPDAGLENYDVEWGCKLRLGKSLGIKAGDTVTVHGVMVSEDEIAAAKIFPGDREAYLACSRRRFWQTPLVILLFVAMGAFLLDMGSGGEPSTVHLGVVLVLWVLLLLSILWPRQRGTS